MIYCAFLIIFDTFARAKVLLFLELCKKNPLFLVYMKDLLYLCPQIDNKQP